MSSKARQDRRSTAGRFTKGELAFLAPLLEVQEAPPLRSTEFLAYTLSSIVLLAVFAGYFFRVDVTTTAVGKVEADGRGRQVQASMAGTVIDVLVRDGDKVKRNQPLVEMDRAVATASLNAARARRARAAAEIQRLDTELATLPSARTTLPPSQGVLTDQERLLAERLGLYAAKIMEAEAEKKQKEHNVEELRSAISFAERSAAVAEERVLAAAPYVGEAISRFDSLKLKDDANTARADLESKRRRLDEAYDAVKSSVARLQQVKNDRMQEVLTTLHERKQAYLELDTELTRSQTDAEKMVVLSPIDGVVTALNIAYEGATVAAGQVLLTVVPVNSKPYVELAVKSDEIGFIRVGQEVRVKLDAFPSELYGDFAGHISMISPDSFSEGQAPDSHLGSPDQRLGHTSSYVVQVVPDEVQARISVIGMMQVGMNVHGDIVLDNRRVGALLLSPVIKYWNEGISVH